MTYISRLVAPDLSELPAPVLAQYILNMIFHGTGPRDASIGSYTTNYIRVTDLAVEEYETGRALLSEYVSSHNRTLLLLSGLSHFETCIHCVRRALRYFTRLKADPSAPAVDRVTARLCAAYERQVTPIRDAVEHMDEHVSRGEMSAGQPHALLISTDGTRLEIASASLLLTDLAGSLRRLHEFATMLAEPPAPGNSPAV